MLPLSVIFELARGLDHAGHSPVADAVAAAWGHPPGSAAHRRSSASHVFTVGDPDRPVGYLRFVPAADRSRTQVEAVADLMDRLSRSGLPVVGLVRSSTGNLVETVATPLGDMHATLVLPADGVQVDVEELTSERARAWGAALARLHHARLPTRIRLPIAFGELDRVTFGGDPPLAAAVRRLTDRARRLPRGPERFGLVHGDFELDNLAWRGDTPTAYDFDEAAYSWFVADIGRAVRDLDLTPLFEAFLAGYRTVGPLQDGDLEWLPLFSALHAARELARLQPVLDAGTLPDSPAWLVRLRNRLENHLLRQRELVLRRAEP